MYFAMITVICKIKLNRYNGKTLYYTLLTQSNPPNHIGIPQTLSERPPSTEVKNGQTIPLWGKIQADSAWEQGPEHGICACQKVQKAVKNCTRSYICTLSHILLGYQIKQHEMDGACCTLGKAQCWQDLVGKPRGHLEDLVVVSTTLKWILNETVCKGVGWIHLARDKDQANTLMNLSFPQNA